MEGDKRKRGDDQEIDRKRTKKGEEVNAEQTVTEDEVDEFFAILKRIHVAVKYFEKDGREGRRELTDTRLWPGFEAEDFDEHYHVNNSRDNQNGDQKKEEGVEEESGLDLNSDPAPSRKL